MMALILKTLLAYLLGSLSGSLLLGISLGLAAGYFGSWIDTVIMRVGEITTSFPEIFLLLIFVATIKPPMTEWLR